MKILKIIAASSLVLGILAGCGGGGGSGPANTGTPTVLSGVASKGPFLHDSTVNVYAVSNGGKGALLKTTRTTDDAGSYSADLGSYAGPVIVEVSGSYRDEATGRDVPVADTAPIRAAVPMAQGACTLPVTALTELAVQQAATLTPGAITAANALVSGIFKLDIIATTPVAPTAAALAGASQAQKDYTLALAAVSQMASVSAGSSDSDKLKSALSSLSQGITGTGMSSSATTAFQGALGDFVGSNPHNQTGISDTSATGLVNAGTLSKGYALTLQGAPGARGVQFDLALPRSLGVNYNRLDGGLLEGGMVLPAGAPSDLMMEGSYASDTLTVVMVSPKGLNAGVIATLICNVASGASAPSASELVLSHLKVVDAKGAPIPGATVTLN